MPMPSRAEIERAAKATVLGLMLGVVMAALRRPRASGGADSRR